VGVRPLLIDDGLPAGLAEELRARGRDARELWADASDLEALRTVADSGAVLVTAVEALPDEPGATVAIVTGRGAAARRDVVHRHAHEMAAQRPGSRRRYALHRSLP
jgi:hypothetical protein